MKCPNCGKKMKGGVCKKCGYDASVKVEQPATSKTVAWKKYRVYDPANPNAVYSLEVSPQGQPNPALGVISSLPTRVQGVTASAAPQEETKSDDDSDRKLCIGAGWLLILQLIFSIVVNAFSVVEYADGNIFKAILYFLLSMGWLSLIGCVSMLLLGVLCFVKAKKSSSALNIAMGILFSILACSQLLGFVEYSVYFIHYFINGYQLLFHEYLILALQLLTVVESIGMAVIFFKGRSGKGSYVPAISEILQVLLLAVYYGINFYLYEYFSMLTVLSLLGNLMMAAALFLIGKAYKE